MQIQTGWAMYVYRNLCFPSLFKTKSAFGSWRKTGSNRRKVSETEPQMILTCLLTWTWLTGYLYTEFASQADYEYVLNYAKSLNVVLWENASRRSFFGSLEGHPNIRGFIERRARAAGNT